MSSSLQSSRLVVSRRAVLAAGALSAFACICPKRVSALDLSVTDGNLEYDGVCVEEIPNGYRVTDEVHGESATVVFDAPNATATIVYADGTVSTFSREENGTVYVDGVPLPEIPQIYASARASVPSGYTHLSTVRYDIRTDVIANVLVQLLIFGITSGQANAIINLARSITGTVAQAVVPAIYMIQDQYVNYSTYYFFNVQRWYVANTGAFIMETTVGPFTSRS